MQEFGKTADAHQDIVEIMSDPGSQLPNRFHLLRVLELPLQLLSFSYIQHKPDAAVSNFFQRCSADQYRNSIPILLNTLRLERSYFLLRL